MKIKNKKTCNTILFILYMLGWIAFIAVIDREDFCLLFPVVIWLAVIFGLCRENRLEGEKSKIREAFCYIIASNILFPLMMLFVYVSPIFTIGIIAMEVLSVVGTVILIKELWKKAKESLKPKPVSPTPKPVNPTPKPVKPEPKSYVTTDCKCSVCGMIFQEADLQVIDGEYYCQSCFVKKCINSEKDEFQEENIEPQVPCYTTLKNMFEVSSNKEPDQNFLNKFCGSSIFIIYTLATMQPACFQDQLCVYDTKEKAAAALGKYIVNMTFREYFYPQEVKPEELREEIVKCLSSGFQSMIINNECFVSLTDLPVYDKNADYGAGSVSACNYMLCYKERELALGCDEDTANCVKSWDDEEKQKVLFMKVVQMLEESVLLLPDEEHRKKNLENKNLILVFTDRFALNSYFSIPVETTEITLNELYELIEYEEKIAGIVVNPGREDFRMKKKFV